VADVLAVVSRRVTNLLRIQLTGFGCVGMSDQRLDSQDDKNGVRD
jgi:hypothetical protein